jgi:hypothetical protein
MLTPPLIPPPSYHATVDLLAHAIATSTDDGAGLDPRSGSEIDDSPDELERGARSATMWCDEVISAMSRACFIAVLLDEHSTAGSAVEAYVGRIARRVAVRLVPAQAPELGVSFTGDADYVAAIYGADGPEPSPESARRLVPAVLAADDVRAVRVGWWHLGARRTTQGRTERIEVGALDAADWDGTFTLEVRQRPDPPRRFSLRQLALGTWWTTE